MNDPVHLLLIARAGFLFGGFLFGRGDDYRRMPTWTRITSSAVLVVTAVLIAGRQGTLFAALLAVGMGLGFVGDLYMADLIPWPRPGMVGGMAFFGLGHVAYITAGLHYAAQHALTDPAARMTGWLLWLLIGAVGWWVFVWRPAEQPGRLNQLALPYGLLLATTAGTGTGLALQTAAFTPFTIGAGLFLFSDLLIALHTFTGRRFRQMGDLIWLTYGPAQALIIYTGLLV